MAERRSHSSVYSDRDGFVPDKEYPEDGFGQIVGLVEGEVFTRTIRLNSPTGNILEVPTKRQVKVAVMTDADGNYYCEPYSPELHGEEIDLTVMDIDQFEGNEDFFDAQPSLTSVRKAGASRPAYNVEDEWERRGAIRGFKMPK